MPASRTPKCPWCAKPMVYVRSSPGAGGPQKHHYDCKRCIVDYTEVDGSAEPKPDRARRLDKHPIYTLH